MRTTLDLEGDILLAAKELARQRGVSVGKVISDLARQAMSPPAVTKARSAKKRGGVPLFPQQPQAGPVTLELVNRLREESE